VIITAGPSARNPAAHSHGWDSRHAQVRPSGMMIGRVDALAVPDLRPAHRMARPSWPVPASKDAQLLVLRHEVTMLRQTQPRPRMDCADHAVLAAPILQRIRTSSMKDQVKTDDTVLAPHREGLFSRCPGGVARRWPGARRSGRRPPCSGCRSRRVACRAPGRAWARP
jgi:hypothetical protein